MNDFRSLLAAILIPLTAVVITVIGIDQIQAGGDRVSTGVRALIAAGVVWIFAIRAVRRFRKVAAALVESIAAEAGRRASQTPDDDSPGRIM